MTQNDDLRYYLVRVKNLEGFSLSVIEWWNNKRHGLTQHLIVLQTITDLKEKFTDIYH